VRKLRKPVVAETIVWSMPLQVPRVEIVGDSLLVVRWCQGAWRQLEQQYRPLFDGCVNTMAELQDSALCAPRSAAAWWIRHVPREFNERADLLARTCLTSGCGSGWCTGGENLDAISVFFDGGHKHGKGSSAWTMMAGRLAAHDATLPEPSLQWNIIAEGAVYHVWATSVYAELVACHQAVHALKAFLQTGRVTFDHQHHVEHSIIPVLQEVECC